jgi:hypothetical protein
VSAQIFVLEGQEERYRELGLVVRREVFGGENVVIGHRAVGESYRGRRGGPGARAVDDYFRLLRAAMLSTADFTVLVEDGEGNWSYGYEEGKEAFLQLSRKSLPALLPAVAVMGRMVMVPREVYGVLKADNFSWMLRPLEVGGVKLVDFGNADSVRAGAAEVGARLRAEIIALSRRHMLMTGSSEPEFEEIAKLLSLEREFLERHRSAVLESIVRLTPKVAGGPARLGKASRVTLEVFNHSGEPLRRVRVQVRGPGDAMKAPVVGVLDFPSDPAAPQRLPFEISPKASPYCPLQVLFEISETSEWYAPSSVPLLLDVV